MAENKKQEWVWEFGCPKARCGSHERIHQIIVDADRAAGRVGEGAAIGALEVLKFPITDKTRKPMPSDEVSVVTVWSDLCAKCGTRYYFRVLRRVSNYSLDMSKIIHKASSSTPLPPFLMD